MDPNKIKLESGVQLLARLIKKSKIENFYPVLFKSGPKFGEVIEMFSNISLSTLLIDMICEALIPIKLGGAQLSILIFKTDGDFNYDALVECLRKKLEQFKSLFHETMSNLHILEIYDATQFYTTMYNLENIFTEHSDISLIIFDTLTAFYWSEQGFKITKMDMYLKNVLKVIQEVMKDYKITVIYTRPEYFNSSKDTNLETCVNSNTEGLDYRIQLIFEEGVYKVIVKTSQLSIKRHFIILDNKINWI
ncbi:DNA repair protein XRCC2-like [Galleria mellonella]|uniref:DNA repair protein XRCC2-like n=1 Tax=Galleria mellonella TaxID=7137 RepID=A0ABM3N2C8_GALME|nr:DNA repair protein XRCC2-like [Galleria mellonella]